MYVCALNLNEMILFHLEPLNDDPRPVSSCFLEPTGEYNFYSFFMNHACIEIREHNNGVALSASLY